MKTTTRQKVALQERLSVIVKDILNLREEVVKLKKEDESLLLNMDVIPKYFNSLIEAISHQENNSNVLDSREFHENISEEITKLLSTIKRREDEILSLLPFEYSWVKLEIGNKEYGVMKKKSLVKIMLWDLYEIKHDKT